MKPRINLTSSIQVPQLLTSQGHPTLEKTLTTQEYLFKFIRISGKLELSGPLCQVNYPIQLRILEISKPELLINYSSKSLIKHL